MANTGERPHRASARPIAGSQVPRPEDYGGETVAHLSTGGGKEVDKERLRVGEVGLGAHRSRRRREGRVGSRAQVGCGRPTAEGPAPGSPQGLARAAGEPPSPRAGGAGARAEPSRSTGTRREVGTWLTPGGRLTALEARGGRGARRAEGAPEGVALRALPAANDSPSRGSAAAGYSRRAGRTWRAAASRGC